MAHTDNLPDDVLDSIAGKIGERLTGLTESAIPFSSTTSAEASPELRETFALWMLGADDIVNLPSNKLVLMAKPTGRWHHQIKSGVETKTFARSTPLGSDADSWSIREVFYESQLAKNIDKAIDWIDQNIENDPLVRLLAVPAYQLYALWLSATDDSKVLIVDCPSQFTYLLPNQLLGDQQFLAALRHESHIIGIH